MKRKRKGLIPKKVTMRTERKKRRGTRKDWKRSRERENLPRSRRMKRKRRRRSKWPNKKSFLRRWKINPASRRRRAVCSDDVNMHE